LHLDGRVIGEECRGGSHELADMFSQRRQQGRGAAHPIGQRRAMQVDLVAGVDLGLAVEWQVIAIFANQHISRKARAGTAPCDWA